MKTDDYDTAPYEALAAQQAAGENMRDRLYAFVLSRYERPSKLALRLNRHGVAPLNGASEWDWCEVSILRERARDEAARDRRPIIPAMNTNPEELEARLREIEERDERGSDY